MKISIKMEKYQTKERIKRIFLEWVAPLTIQGLPNMFRTDITFIRIVWLISFLCSTGFCCLMITTTIMKYLRFEVSMQLNSIDEAYTVLPQITVCNANPFATKASINLAQEVLWDTGKIDDTTSSVVLANDYPSKYKISQNYQ